MNVAEGQAAACCRATQQRVILHRRNASVLVFIAHLAETIPNLV